MLIISKLQQTLESLGKHWRWNLEVGKEEKLKREEGSFKGRRLNNRGLKEVIIKVKKLLNN